jgi:hypothetical protein
MGFEAEIEIESNETDGIGDEDGDPKFCVRIRDRGQTFDIQVDMANAPC